MMKKFAAMLALTALVGCATNYGVKSPAEVARAVQVKDSPFDSKKFIGGPAITSETKRVLIGDLETTYLGAEKDRSTGSISGYTVAVRIIYSGAWRFYQTASFMGGQHVDVKVLGREAGMCSGGCVFTETIAIPVSEQSLLNAKGGFQFRLNSKSGHENVITVPLNYIEGFLEGAKGA